VVADALRLRLGGCIMQNISFTTKGSTLIITITDITVPGELSSSGKSFNVASTGGNVPIPGTNLKLGVNLFKPNYDYVAPQS